MRQSRLIAQQRYGEHRADGVLAPNFVAYFCLEQLGSETWTALRLTAQFPHRPSRPADREPRSISIISSLRRTFARGSKLLIGLVELIQLPESAASCALRGR